MSGSNRYYLLDAMRGLGALAVLHFHAFGLGSGYLAVDFFFILSGFVIGLRYQEQLETKTTSFSSFCRGRALRLYPLYFAGLLIGVTSYVWHSGNDLQIPTLITWLLPNLFVLPAPTATTNFFPLNTPGWSLFYEAIINVAFAIFLYRLRTINLAIMGLISGMLVFASIFYHGHLGGWTWETLHIGVFRVAFSFILGLLLARNAPSRKISWIWSIALMSALTAVFYVPASYNVWVILLSILVLNTSIMAASVRVELPKILHKPASILGDISYPLYIIHAPLIEPVLAGLKSSGLSRPVQAIVLTALFCIVAYLVGLGANWLQRRMSRRPRPASSQHAPVT